MTYSTKERNKEKYIRKSESKHTYAKHTLKYDLNKCKTRWFSYETCFNLSLWDWICYRYDCAGENETPDDLTISFLVVEWYHFTYCWLILLFFVRSFVHSHTVSKSYVRKCEMAMWRPFGFFLFVFIFYYLLRCGTLYNKKKCWFFLIIHYSSVCTGHEKAFNGSKQLENVDFLYDRISMLFVLLASVDWPTKTNWHEENCVFFFFHHSSE